ncbi:MAG: hypothetical protein M0006_08000 [Magnetospirillum sp.]|nr:hypothetical protein [Magnetospirillum sp.]
MDIEMVAILSGVVVVGLAFAAKLMVGRLLAARPVRAEDRNDA